MSQAKVMYGLGAVLFLLNVIGFAIQGYLIGLGGIFLIAVFALYMLAVFLYHRSAKRLATLLALIFGLVAIVGAFIAETQGGGYLL
ncbi:MULTISPECIES: hypothetical protein [Shouchella]|uniref:Uncharacterized protein n=3 Tax=Bacillaceae TaxID=186817 RepID=A0A060LXN0_9BACI|nr:MULTISPECIES: hypothetical protein [Bacillaceae]RQW20400.1 hypothetical protein EH196_09780 [Bacillus sp. C1-1]AIC94525.1 hypothetical protein BleG1_1947 [Shouchella lehensis G1]KQL51907.1 hypothetical protein AN965_19325 [Alkalicoccobacillus plakortidis]MBG9784574.1 hypothetical protein [Shouchella lehensis]TES50414.1 hypothetical protein E2L03_00320 [Shouchella lehensis]